MSAEAAILSGTIRAIRPVVGLWWDHIVSLDLPARCGVKIQAPELHGWAVVAGTTDPPGALRRLAEAQT